MVLLFRRIQEKKPSLFNCVFVFLSMFVFIFVTLLLLLLMNGVYICFVVHYSCVCSFFL